MTYVLVAGAAHLDILASTSDASGVIDKEGELTISFGGTGHNIATNMALLGFETAFMSALNTGPISDLILRELRQNMVRLHMQRLDTDKEAGFVAQLKDGDLKSAVTASLIDKTAFDDSFILEAMEDAKCLVVDANLNLKTIEQVIKLAEKSGKAIYFAAVSEVKAEKVLKLKGRLNGVFLNKLEMNHLQKVLGVASWQDVAEKTGHSFMITHGGEGATWLTPEQESFYKNPKPQADAVNKIGCGDLFLSAFVGARHFRDASLEDAVATAFDVALKALDHEQAHLGQDRSFELGVRKAMAQAQTDMLTGIYNRLGVEQFVATLNPANHDLSVLFLDVDYFKKVNDTFGHEAGDEVLKHVAETLQENMRQQDAVGRWGGEEFVCVLPKASPEDARKTAERIRKAVHSRKQAALNNEPVSVSIGVATRQKQEDFKGVLARADKALYHAKESGRNQVQVANPEG